MDILIKNGKLIDPINNIDDFMDLLIKDGKVAAVRHKGLIEGEINISRTKVIDASGCLVLPGLIDMHTHLREPGHEYKETILTGSQAGAKGGFTSLACMANTDPVTDNETTVRFILEKAKEAGILNIYPVGSISKGLKGKEISNIGDIIEAGGIAISDDGNPVMDSQLMRRALEYSKVFNIPVISHCEDIHLSKGGSVNESLVSTMLGLRGIPNSAEEVMVARDISLAKLTGGKLHIAHVSTARAVNIIRQAKEDGINVTCEVTPHHLLLSDKAVEGFDTNTKVNPPLRSIDDIEELQRGLNDDTIDVIATDHAPHSCAEKDLEYDYASFGISGIETALPLCMGLYHRGILSLKRLVSKLSAAPSDILNIDKGRLSPNADADITIINPDKEGIIDSEKFYSKGKNSPFNGWKVKGSVEKTICSGKIVFSAKDYKDTN